VPQEHDFACAYEVSIAPDDSRSSEQWARAVWEGAPAPLRWFMLAGWRLVLRLRLGPRHSPDHVLGWLIVDSSPGETVCHLDSGLLSAHNVFHKADRTLVWSTFVTYKGLAARVIWLAVSALHRFLVRIALRRAAGSHNTSYRAAGVLPGATEESLCAAGGAHRLPTETKRIGRDDERSSDTCPACVVARWFGRSVGTSCRDERMRPRLLVERLGR
jgi:hypothetical protein